MVKISITLYLEEKFNVFEKIDEMNDLNFYQKNSFRASLYGFEEALHQIERWLEKGEESGILYIRTLHLKPETKKLVRQQVNKALEKINELALKYRLERREEDLTMSILSQISISWADLSDTRSRRLKGYGDIGSVISEEIDEDIDSLSEISMKLFKIIDKTRSVEHVNENV